MVLGYIRCNHYLLFLYLSGAALSYEVIPDETLSPASDLAR